MVFFSGLLHSSVFAKENTHSCISYHIFLSCLFTLKAHYSRTDSCLQLLNLERKKVMLLHVAWSCILHSWRKRIDDINDVLIIFNLNYTIESIIKRNSIYRNYYIADQYFVKIILDSYVFNTLCKYTAFHILILISLSHTYNLHSLDCAFHFTIWLNT
jgi:hypothetical protein